LAEIAKIKAIRIRRCDLKYLDVAIQSHTLTNFICTGWYCGAVEVHASLVIGVVRDSAYDCGHEITLARRNFSHGGLVLLSLFVFGTMESDLGLCTGDGSGMKSHIKEDNNYKHMLKPY
jgi:hypothetical protein